MGRRKSPWTGRHGDSQDSIRLTMRPPVGLLLRPGEFTADGSSSSSSAISSSSGQPFARSHSTTASNSATGTPSGPSSHSWRTPAIVSEPSGQPLACAHCSTARWPPHAAYRQVHSLHSQPLARNHVSTAKWPPPAAREHVSLSHGQPLACAHCSTARWPSVSDCIPAGFLFPRAAVGMRPLEHRQVTTLGCCRARALAPFATVRARPLQHSEMVIRGCRPRDAPIGCTLVPRAAEGMGPLEHVQVAALSGQLVCAVPLLSLERSAFVRPSGGFWQRLSGK
jgi:hypothetical protein